MAQKTDKTSRKTTTRKSAGKAPWKRSNPRKRAGKVPKHLTLAEKATAKRRAKRAGRKYPNLVDNMRVASRKTTSKTKSSKTTSKTKRTKKA